MLIVLAVFACSTPQEECYAYDPSSGGIQCAEVQLCCVDDEPCVLRTAQGVDYRCDPSGCEGAATNHTWCDPDVCTLTDDEELTYCGGAV